MDLPPATLHAFIDNKWLFLLWIGRASKRISRTRLRVLSLHGEFGFISADVFGLSDKDFDLFGPDASFRHVGLLNHQVDRGLTSGSMRMRYWHDCETVCVHTAAVGASAHSAKEQPFVQKHVRFRQHSSRD